MIGSSPRIFTASLREAIGVTLGNALRVLKILRDQYGRYIPYSTSTTMEGSLNLREHQKNIHQGPTSLVRVRGSSTIPPSWDFFDWKEAQGIVGEVVPGLLNSLFSTVHKQQNGHFHDPP